MFCRPFCRKQHSRLHRTQNAKKWQCVNQKRKVTFGVAFTRGKNPLHETFYYLQCTMVKHAKPIFGPQNALWFGGLVMDAEVLNTFYRNSKSASCD